MKSLLVGQRLYALVALFAAVLLLLGFMGLRSSSDIVAGLKTVYEDRTVALGDLLPIVRVLRDNRAQFALGLQHAPGNALAALHDHPASFHADQIEKNQQMLDAEQRDQITVPACLREHAFARIDEDHGQIGG